MWNGIKIHERSVIYGGTSAVGDWQVTGVKMRNSESRIHVHLTLV